MRDLDIRRPDLRGVRRSGAVRWYKADKGYGRITADDDEVLFVHFSEIASEQGYRDLAAGQRVSFVWNGGIQDHGRHRATDVRAEDDGRSVAEDDGRSVGEKGPTGAEMSQPRR